MSLSRHFNYISRNICPCCTTRALAKGYRLCEICIGTRREREKEHRIEKNIYNKARYDELKERGLCATCKIPTDGNVYCRVCTTDKCRTRAYKRPLHSRNRWSKR